MDMFKTIYELGIIPVVAIDDADKAVPLAKALSEGGLPAADRHRSGGEDRPSPAD